ncbi:DUF6112 family protein [Euzebya tangerina]|uniref:DUF6112 family protein n=1 Tax=Euzebya tangerina TaxID=591198 RepID=UPI00196B80B4|nr:DUF6112 family protein [Euzebya tangerina]
MFPDLDAIARIDGLGDTAGALATIVLVVAVAVLIGSGVAWALATAVGNPRVAQRARTGLGVAIAATVLVGSATVLISFLIRIGSRL